MRMTVVLIAATAMLCGFSVGLVAGTVMVWALFIKKPARPDDEIWSDYGGL